MPDLRRRYRGYMLVSYLVGALVILAVMVLLVMGVDDAYVLMGPVLVLIGIMILVDRAIYQRELHRRARAGEFGLLRGGVLAIYLDNQKALDAEVAVLQDEIAHLESTPDSGLRLAEIRDILDDLTSEDVRITARLADDYYQMENWEKARQELVRLRRYLTDNAVVLSNLSAVMRQFSDQHQHAITLAIEAISLAPDLAAAYNNRGIALMDDFPGSPPDLAAAAADLEQATRLDPDRLEPWVNRAILSTGAKDPDAVISSCTEALQRDPTLIMMRSMRAQNYALRGDFDAALADCDWLLAQDPDRAETLVERASAHLMAKQADAALIDLDQAIRQNPNLATAYLFRAIVCAVQNRYADSLIDINRAIKLGLKNAVVFRTRANTRFLTEDYVGSRDDFTQTIDLEPRSASGYGGRAAAEFCLGDYEAAVADGDTAIGLSATDANCYANRGASHFMLGHPADARRDCEAALALDPELKAARVTLALLDFDEGRIDDAGQRWQTLIAQEQRFRDPGWTAHEYRLPERMRDLARQLIDGLPPVPSA